MVIFNKSLTVTHFVTLFTSLKQQRNTFKMNNWLQNCFYKPLNTLSTVYMLVVV